MMKFKSPFVLLYLVLFFAILACHQNVVYEKNISIKKHKWHKFDTIDFVVNIPDTSVFYDININVRNGGRYEYSNLFVFVKVIAPTGNHISDIVEIPLADKRGNWYGSGLGDIKFLSAPYKRNIKFRTSGIYKFRLVQGMRNDEINKIFDIGLRIQKSKISKKLKK